MSPEPGGTRFFLIAHRVQWLDVTPAFQRVNSCDPNPSLRRTPRFRVVRVFRGSTLILRREPSKPAHWSRVKDLFPSGSHPAARTFPKKAARRFGECAFDAMRSAASFAGTDPARDAVFRVAIPLACPTIFSTPMRRSMSPWVSMVRVAETMPWSSRFCLPPAASPMPDAAPVTAYHDKIFAWQIDGGIISRRSRLPHRVTS